MDPMNILEIVTATLSLIPCIFVFSLGFISPVYRYIISVFIVIAYIFIVFSILAYCDPGMDNYDNNVELIFWECSLWLYGFNMIMLMELWACLKNPFCPVSQRYLQYSIIVIIIIVIDFYLYYLWYTHDITMIEELMLNLYTRAISIYIIFTVVIIISLKQSKKSQAVNVYQFKRKFLKAQLIWFYSIIIIQIGYVSSQEKSYLLTLLYLQGFIFGLAQLKEKFARMKLKTWFLRIACNQEDINLVAQIESGKVQSQEYSLSIVLLKEAQTIEVVKAILKSVCSCVGQSFQYQTQEYEEERLYRFNFDLNQYDEDDNNIHQSKCRTQVFITTFYPDQFRDLMASNGYNYDLIIQTLSLQFNQQAFLKTKESMGKSGAFFFFSENDKLILKTMTLSELNNFRNNRVQKYFEYIVNNPQSVIAKTYGLFIIRTIGFQPIYLILMENTLQLMKEAGHQYRLYDLKGSRVNRTSGYSDSVKKDNNYLSSADYPVTLQDNSISKQLKLDSEFLLSINYMDYSLLLGIMDMNTQYDGILQSPRLLEFKNKLYHFSIIDYLQVYDCSKKCEYYYKSISKDKAQLSSGSDMRPPTIPRVKHKQHRHQILRIVASNVSIQLLIIIYCGLLVFKYNVKYVLLYGWLIDVLGFMSVVINRKVGTFLSILYFLEKMLSVILKIGLLLWDIESIPLYYIPVAQIVLSTIIIFFVARQFKGVQLKDQIISQLMYVIFLAQILILTLKWCAIVDYSYFQIFIITWIVLAFNSFLIIILVLSFVEKCNIKPEEQDPDYNTCVCFWLLILFLGVTVSPFFSLYNICKQLGDSNEQQDYNILVIMIFTLVYTFVLLISTCKYIDKVQLFLRQEFGRRNNKQQDKTKSKWKKLRLPIFFLRISSTYFKLIGRQRPTSPSEPLYSMAKPDSIVPSPCITAKELKSSPVDQKSMEFCMICFENEPEIIMVPCYHGGICSNCGEQLIKQSGECFLCRRKVQLLVKVSDNKGIFEGRVANRVK